MNRNSLILETASRPSRVKKPNLPQLGMGGHPLGEIPLSYPDRQAERTMEEALSRGIRYFDTAPSYGNGLSEHRYGRILRTLPRESFLLSSKVGRLIRANREGPLQHGRLPMRWAFDYSRDGALRSIDDSLQRLGVSYLDIVFIHDVDHRAFPSPDAYDAAFAQSMDGAYRALSDLRDEGVVGAIGVGVNEVSPCVAFAAAGDFDCFMLAGRYTLLDHAEALDTLFPICLDKEIKILMAGPYNSGILATGAKPGASFFYEAAKDAVLARVRDLETVCERFHVPLAAAALQFPLRHEAVSTVVVGAQSQLEVQQNSELLQLKIPEELWLSLKHSGLIDNRCP